MFQVIYKYSLKINRMNKVLFLVVVALIYMGAASIGLQFFGEGAGAAFFGLIVGTIGFLWFMTHIKDKD